MTAKRVRLLRETHRRFASGGVGWARRRELIRIGLACRAWRLRCALAPRLKRALDLGGSLVLVAASAPLCALIAVAIRLADGGPAIYRQVRVGRHGRIFVMYKFRSMIANADALKAQLTAQNEMPEGVLFKMRDDPRMTQVGRFLRRTSLDELPQLLNVIRGEMTLVGPRPPVPSEVALYDPGQRRRLAAAPGITCLWQISGRNEIDFSGQVRLDVEYIERQTLGLDLAILLRTLPAVLSQRGAS